MTSKRKREDQDDEREVERAGRRQRRRKRSSSAPLGHDSHSPEKRRALRRLFGRFCSVELDEETRVRAQLPPMLEDLDDTEPEDDNDENEDPLLEAVPVHMDPEQLGFLVCAQETLRFLAARGIPAQHPVFVRLRTRLLRGIDEMAVA